MPLEMLDIQDSMEKGGAGYGWWQILHKLIEYT